MARIIIILLSMVVSVACQSLPENRIIPLEKLLKRDAVIATSLVPNDQGILYVQVKSERASGYFLLDTGATQSALFRGSGLADISKNKFSGSANIFGLVEHGNFPLISIDDLVIEAHSIPKMEFVVLPGRDDQIVPNSIKGIDGLLGMDFINGYNLFVDWPSLKIYFLPHSVAQPDIVESWIPVKLMNNPNSEFGRELNFFNLRVGNHIFPALFDTGSEFNVINWQATQIPALKRLQRRLRKNWEIQGATGAFDPSVRIDVNALRAGQMRWSPKKFIVMNFDHLDGIGFKDKALVIAGSPLLKDKRFFIDFKRKTVWFEPGPAPN